ncbi:MAG: TonB family protein, partial [Bacteroidaceae bacterium]|nr:TonB family protein [Bacteroidaceae bacterium]
HNHSAERVAMELLCSLMWWNPFSWIARRHLMEVHEYEADADVLKSGYDVSIYIQTILKSLLGYSPDIANGLRDSLTQKRFKMMTRKTSSRYALLRTLAIVPMLAGLLCAFSFTAKATQYIDTSSQTPDRKLLEVKVTDTQGKPMKGAVVLMPDGRGYKTDENGRADVKNGSVEELSFNYVGHAVKSISVDNKADKATVNVTMDIVPQYIIGAHIFNYDKSEHRVFKMYDDEANEAIAQTEKSLGGTPRPLAEGEARFVKVEQAVLYDGGNVNKFRNYIQSTVKYPSDAIRKKAHGNVTVEFIVEADASLSNINVTKSPDMSLTDEVIRAINAAPLKWTPAMQSGEPTRMKCYMTINFSLEKDDYLRRLTNIITKTTFNGGDAAEEFKKYMQQTLRYPKLAQKSKSVGRVAAHFMIDENALPCNIEIITPVDDILAAEVTRVIANSRGWELVRNTNISQDITQTGGLYCIAVDFSLQDENGIVTAPIRRDLSDERLQEITGGNFIGSVNVMVYDK